MDLKALKRAVLIKKLSTKITYYNGDSKALISLIITFKVFNNIPFLRVF